MKKIKVIIIADKATPDYWKPFEGKIGQIIKIGHKRKGFYPTRYEVQFSKKVTRWFRKEQVMKLTDKNINIILREWALKQENNL